MTRARATRLGSKGERKALRATEHTKQQGGASHEGSLTRRSWCRVRAAMMATPCNGTLAAPQPRVTHCYSGVAVALQAWQGTGPGQAPAITRRRGRRSESLCTQL